MILATTVLAFVITAAGGASTSPTGFEPTQESRGPKRILIEWSIEYEKFLRSLAPLSKKANSEIELGNWAEALAAIEEIEAAYKASKYAHKLSPFRHRKFEALLGLGRYKEVVDLMEHEKNPRQLKALETNILYAVARAELGSLKPHEARKFSESIYRYFTTFERGSLTTNLNEDPIAMVRLARATDSYSSARDALVETEAAAVLKRSPTQPLAAYYYAASLSRKKKYDEARKYWEIAATMKNPWGEEASRQAHKQRKTDGK